jgi:hypothetical protein
MLLNYFFHRRRQGEDAELNEPPVLVFCYPEGLCLLSTVVVRTDTHIFSEVTLFFFKSVYPSQRLCSYQGSVEVPVERKKSRWCSWCRERNQQGRAGQGRTEQPLSGKRNMFFSELAGQHSTHNPPLHTSATSQRRNRLPPRLHLLTTVHLLAEDARFSSWQ